MRRAPIWLLAALSFMLAAPVMQAQNKPSIELTIYNQGAAQIRETRSIALQAGETTLELQDLPETLDPTSLTFLSLSDPNGTTLQEQSFHYDLGSLDRLFDRYRGESLSITAADGSIITGDLLREQHGELFLRGADGQLQYLQVHNARDIQFPALPEPVITQPTLKWRVQSSTGGEQQIEISYLAGGMIWSADYTLLLAADEASLDLTGWVTVENRSGKAYDGARLKLVAGDIERLEAQPEMLAETRMMAMDMADEAAPTFQQRELFEYQLYEIARPLHIRNRESQQIQFLRAAAIPASTMYILDLSPPAHAYYHPIDRPNYDSASGAASTVLQFGGEDSTLADLPAGRARVYQRDMDGARLLIGENRIDHSPQGEQVRIPLGSAFDLRGERLVSDFSTPSATLLRESFEITLRNHKDEAVEVLVPERLYRWGEWEISESSLPYRKRDASTIEFLVPLAAGEEASLHYTVQYSLPRRR